MQKTILEAVHYTKGVERGGDWGGSVPLPRRLGGLAERRELPQRPKTDFFALYSCQKAPCSNHFEYFEVHVFH